MSDIPKMIRGPDDDHIDPEALAGILIADAVEDARRAAERFGGRDEKRLE